MPFYFDHGESFFFRGLLLKKEKSITSFQINLETRFVNMNLMLMNMETKMSSNDFGSRADNSYKKNFDYQIDKMIESYLDRWDPYDYGR